MIRGSLCRGRGQKNGRKQAGTARVQVQEEGARNELGRKT